MTDTISQAKERLDKANCALINAAEKLQNLKNFLNESEQDRNLAQEDFDTKTLNYSLAIQKVNQLSEQTDVPENDLLLANKALELAKLDYQLALISNNNHKYLIQSTFHNVTSAQIRYDKLKLQFDFAKDSYDRLLREQHIATPEIDKTLENHHDHSGKNIGFLMNFLKQSPLAAFEYSDNTKNNESDQQLATDAATGIKYDESIPFEKRPAIERPVLKRNTDNIKPAKPNQTGHITWEFNPDPHNK